MRRWVLSVSVGLLFIAVPSAHLIVYHRFLNPRDVQGNPLPVLWLRGDALWQWSGWVQTSFKKGWGGYPPLDSWAIRRVAEFYRGHPPVNEDLAERLWQALIGEAHENQADRFAFEACRQAALKYLAGKDFQDRFFLPAFARVTHHVPLPFRRSFSGDFWVFGFAWGLEDRAVPRGWDLEHVHWVVVNVKPPHKIVSSIACG